MCVAMLAAATVKRRNSALEITELLIIKSTRERRATTLSITLNSIKRNVQEGLCMERRGWSLVKQRVG